MTDDALSLPAAAGALRRGTVGLARRLRAERPDDPISLGKVSLMSHLVRQGSLTPGQLATAERLQPQSLTRQLAELEAEGLVTRSTTEVDRRRSLISLTAAGRAALARDMHSRDRWLAGALAHLSPAERELLRIAASLMEQLADYGPHDGAALPGKQE